MSRTTTRLLHARIRPAASQLAAKRSLSTAVPSRTSPILYGMVGLAVGAVGTSVAYYSGSDTEAKQSIEKEPKYANKPTMIKVRT